jgi:hypothetical protein
MTAPVKGAAGSITEHHRELKDSCRRAVAQGLPPLERHIIPDDKRILFAVAPVHRLVGTWQGPGSIAEMRQRARP